MTSYLSISTCTMHQAVNNYVAGDQTNICLQGPVLCGVYARHCLGVTPCVLTYCGKQDGIHFWSGEVAAGDEIGWDFCARVMSSRTSFTAFCNSLSRQYLTTNVLSAPFMSRATFVVWFFSWAGSQKIDFRKGVDPWCGHSPKFLAGDGTHVGISLRRLRLSKPIEHPDLNTTETPLHRRYDRVFLSYRDDVSDDLVRKARQHLTYLSERALSNLSKSEELDVATVTTRNKLLLQSAPHDPSIQLVLSSFANCIYSAELCHAIGLIMRMLASDAPVITLLPWRFHDSLLESCAALKSNDNILHNVHAMLEYAPELAHLCNAAISNDSLHEIVNFMEYLVSFVRSVHAQDVPFDDGQQIQQSYDPESGTAYYFTQHGCQVRQMPTYNVTSRSLKDDTPASCMKHYPSVSRGGFTYSFLWFCPIHGHCYGFHTIAGAEGRKDPFSSLFKYLSEPPEEIFYDFACSLHEYAMNRAPAFFKGTRFWHDIFHGYTHKCAKSFNSSRLTNLLMVNSEICEQFNSFIQCIQYTGTHLTQSHFCFFMQFFIHIWNGEKTKSFMKKRDVALAGSL